MLLPLVIVIAPEPAWALKPGTHRDLAERACKAERLPDSFCRRAGKQVYETDFLEWTDLSAHAQREQGQDLCSAADAALARVDRLARSIVDQANAGRLEDVAIDVGRVIHTLQDECAHHGMSNDEHAFLSMTMTCTGEEVSPDVQPEALVCAETRTREAMAMIARALATVQWGNSARMCVDFDNRDVCANALLPSPFMACDFLAQHKEWDGADTSWHSTLVGDALVATLAAGLAGEPTTRSACGGNPTAIDPAQPHARVDDRTIGCTLTDVVCLGKADGEEVIEEQPEVMGGCSTGSPTGPGLAVMALALIFLARRRR